MQLRGRPLTCLALLAAAAGALAGATSASAQIFYTPCGDSNHFACGHLTVALDPSGAMAGTLTLALRRHRAPVGEARSAIIALAGGPGQPALPLTEQITELLGQVASTRDLIVFDQRGLGLSHPLSCHAFERPDLFRSIGPLVEACAAQLGPTRTLYASSDTVSDIEAIRQAGGYEKLVLYGTSYGTKVAELYAQAHPSQVEALVLDSVVPPNGPDPLNRATFAAIPRVLDQICAGRACAGITTSPVADLARVLDRAGRGSLSGRAFDGEGKPHTVAVSADGIFSMLLAGDFSPALRAQLVTAVRAAALGDSAPLARLFAVAESAGGGEPEDFDTPLYYATSCEDQPFTWSRTATPQARLAEASAAAAALPASVFAPFTAATALDAGNVRECSGWPYQAPAPAPNTAPLPAVPALILSGSADLRTPTAGAQAVAGSIPGASLLVVPDTGHSVLGTDPSSCASHALQALFAGQPIKACVAQRPAPPPPLPPQRLALVSATHGYSGRVGRTLHAVTLSLADFERELVLSVSLDGSEGLQRIVAGVRIGGLRGGWASLRVGGSARISLRGYSYVPGVTISGTISPDHASLTIAGSAAVHGTLGLGAHGALVGTLGGHHVHVAASSYAAAAIVRADAQASPTFGPDGPAQRRLARELAGLLPGIVGP